MAKVLPVFDVLARVAPDATPAPLLAVHSASAVVRAGYGSATAQVRTLDAVSLEIHAGELLLVRSRAAGGALALRAALAGARRGLSGNRHVGAGVFVRRGCISRAARDAIVAAWQLESTRVSAHVSSHGSARMSRRGMEHVAAEAPACDVARVVYLLRVRTDAPEMPLTGSALRAWRDWASTLRSGLGAVVLFSIDDHDSSTHRSPSSHATARVHEARAPFSVAHGGSYGGTFGATHRVAHGAMPRATGGALHEAPGRVRMLTLSAGRIVHDDGPEFTGAADPPAAPA